MEHWTSCHYMIYYRTFWINKFKWCFSWWQVTSTIILCLELNWIEYFIIRVQGLKFRGVLNFEYYCNFSKIIPKLKSMKPKNKDQTSFYECCDLTKEVFLKGTNTKLLLQALKKQEFSASCHVVTLWAVYQSQAGQQYACETVRHRHCCFDFEEALVLLKTSP